MDEMDGRIARRIAGALWRGFRTLLTSAGNPKTDRSLAKGYLTAILHLAPARSSGYNVCKDASIGCTNACLNFAGHGGIFKAGATSNPVQDARIARTKLLFEQRSIFNSGLVEEITKHVARAKRRGLIPVVRLNGTSDLPWERMKMNDGRTILEAFPTLQMYDYTKSLSRMLAFVRGEMPANYHLTFSRSECNEGEVDLVIARGGNVAVVFATKQLPTLWHNRPVINGDADDLRFLDPQHVIVGLTAKGRARHDTSGFVIRPEAK
jgi:hypothetical protein